MTVGLIALTSVAIFTLLGYVKEEHADRLEVLSLYWHFVDAVWVVVFTVVYVIGRPGVYPWLTNRRRILAGTVRIPAPTAWPMVFAFGITMLFAGLVTDESVSVLGAIVSIAAAVGWFRAVLPHEAHESVAGDAGSCCHRDHARAKSTESRSGRKHAGHGCPSKSTRFRRESRAAWREASPWRCSQ